MDDNTVLGEFPDPTPSPVGGNSIWVRHGTELVKYCHFRKGTIPAELMKKGAAVHAGHMLGRAGKTAQEFFDDKGLRLIFASSYLEGGKRKWIGIAQGGDWANRLIIKPDLASFAKETQALFDDKGLRLIHVTTWVEGGKRKWLGISRSGNWANRWWISPDAGSFRQKSQELFDHEGKRLVHVTTYVEGTQRKWLGISRSGDWANRWFVRNDLDSFNLEAQRLFDDEGLRLVHVEMLG